MATTKEEGEVEYEKLLRNQMASASVSEDAVEEETEDDTVSLDASISAEEAQRRKQAGNEFYKEGDYKEAESCYTDALRSAHVSTIDRSVFLANRAAARLKLGEFKAVIQDTTEALKLQPGYKKALARRAEAREAERDFAGAAEDAKELGAPTERVNRLEAAAREKSERDKNEAIDQLKGLGNAFLSNFGLSLDNFKMEQDPNTGSYNVQMRQ